VLHAFLIEGTPPSFDMIVAVPVSNRFESVELSQPPIEFVFDVDGADSAAASGAHRAGPTMHLQLDGGLSRQASIVELAANHVLKPLARHERAHDGELSSFGAIRFGAGRL
jgi:hypothetical protein